MLIIELHLLYSVFLETEGIKFDMNHEEQKVMQLIGLEILKLEKNLKNQKLLNHGIQFIKKFITILSNITN